MMKKKSRFGLALVIYCLVLIAVICGGLAVLWKYMESYELSRPDPVAEAWLAAADEAYWRGGVEDAIAAGTGPYNSRSASCEDYGIVLGGEVKLRGAGGNDTEKYYDLSTGGVALGRLTLEQAGDVGFGEKSWSVRDMVFDPGNNTSLEITAPEDATVWINGVELERSLITDTPEMSIDAEHGFDVAPAGVLYAVDGLRGPVEPTAVSGAGTELVGVVSGDRAVDFAPAPDHGFDITVTEDSAVVVNGVDITGSYCAGIGGAGQELGLLRYECSGLYAVPAIEVTREGSAQTAVPMVTGECYVQGAAASLPEDAAAYAEEFLRKYINFSANVGDSVDANFAVMCQYVVRDSELYERMAAYLESLEWVKGSKLTVNSLEIFDYIPLPDGGFYCRAHYDVTNTMTFQTREAVADCELVVTMLEGDWRVAAMTQE